MEQKKGISRQHLAIVSADMRLVSSASHGNAMQSNKFEKRKDPGCWACKPAVIYETDPQWTTCGIYLRLWNSGGQTERRYN